MTSLTVSTFHRAPDAAARAAAAARRLVRTVAAWADDVALDVHLRCDTRGTITCTLGALGAARRGWEHDVIGALDPIGTVVRRRARALPTPTGLVEIVRDPARVVPVSGEPDRRQPQLPATVWPTPTPEVGELLQVLHRTRGGFVRMLLSAPTALERSMLHESMASTWDRGTGRDFDVAFGVPVRARTFVGTTGRSSFAALRSVVHSWGTGLIAEPVDPGLHARFADIDVIDLAGHVRPESWALAALRLPASGTVAPAGLATALPAVAPRPLRGAGAHDPAAITLGTAVSPTGRVIDAQLAVSAFNRHVLVEGKSGTGKTTALAHMISQLVDRGVGVTLLEHHGQGVDTTLAAMGADAARRAIVVRHGDAGTPTPLNIVRSGGTRELRNKTKSEFIEFMQAHFDPTGAGIVGPRWRRWLSLLWDGVTCVFGEAATLLHIVSVASDPDRTTRLADAVARHDRELASRIRREITDLRGEDAANLTAWAVSKFQPMLEQPAMRGVLGRADDAIDLARVVADGAPLLVDLGGVSLGSGAARMLGTIWLLKHWVALGPGRRPHVLVVDEAHLYRNGPLPALLAEARKFGLGIVLAGQSVNALDGALQDAVEANVGSVLSLRLGLTTAARASARLDGWPADELLRLPDLHAATVLSRNGVPSEPFLLRIPAPTLDEDTTREVAAERSLPSLRRWRAMADEPIVSDESVDRSLAALRPAARLSTRPTATARQSTPSASFLDDWLAARTTARDDDASSASPGSDTPMSAAHAD